VLADVQHDCRQRAFERLRHHCARDPRGKTAAAAVTAHIHVANRADPAHRHRQVGTGGGNELASFPDATKDPLRQHRWKEEMRRLTIGGSISEETDDGGQVFRAERRDVSRIDWPKTVRGQHHPPHRTHPGRLVAS